MIDCFGSIWSAMFKAKTSVDANFARTEAPLTTGERGSYAAQALHNPVLAEAFEEIEREAIVIWKDTPADEYDHREFIWRYIKVLRQVKGRLEKYIADAKIDAYNMGSRTGKSGNQE